MATIARTTPTILAVVDYWREHVDDIPNLEAHWIGWGEPFCFTCGWLPPVRDGLKAWTRVSGWLDRAHLQDHWVAGDDSPSNIVMLCHECHDDMPMFTDRDTALAWVSDHPHAGGLWQWFTDGKLRGRKPSRGTTMLRARLQFERLMHGTAPNQTTPAPAAGGGVG